MTYYVLHVLCFLVYLFSPSPPLPLYFNPFPFAASVCCVAYLLHIFVPLRFLLLELDMSAEVFLTLDTLSSREAILSFDMTVKELQGSEPYDIYLFIYLFILVYVPL